MPEISIKQVREKYPQYNDISDLELGQKLHAKFYSDIPFNEFSAKIGLSQKTSLASRVADAITPGFMRPIDPVQTEKELLADREARGLDKPRFSPATTVDATAQAPQRGKAVPITKAVPQSPRVPSAGKTPKEYIQPERQRLEGEGIIADPIDDPAMFLATVFQGPTKLAERLVRRSLNRSVVKAISKYELTGAVATKIEKSANKTLNRLATVIGDDLKKNVSSAIKEIPVDLQAEALTQIGMQVGDSASDGKIPHILSGLVGATAGSVALTTARVAMRTAIAKSLPKGGVSPRKVADEIVGDFVAKSLGVPRTIEANKALRDELIVQLGKKNIPEKVQKRQLQWWDENVFTSERLAEDIPIRAAADTATLKLPPPKDRGEGFILKGKVGDVVEGSTSKFSPELASELRNAPKQLPPPKPPETRPVPVGKPYGVERNIVKQAEKDAAILKLPPGERGFVLRPSVVKRSPKAQAVPVGKEPPARVAIRGYKETSEPKVIIKPSKKIVKSKSGQFYKSKEAAEKALVSRIKDAKDKVDDSFEVVSFGKTKFAFRQKPRTTADIIKDVKTLASAPVKGQRGSVGDKQASAEAEAAYIRLTKDMKLIRSAAKKAGVSVEEYLTKQGIPKKTAQLLAREEIPVEIRTSASGEKREVQVAGSINLNRLGIDEKAKQNLVDVSKKGKPLTWETTTEAANKILSDVNEVKKSLRRVNAAFNEDRIIKDVKAIRQAAVNNITRLQKLLNDKKLSKEEFIREYMDMSGDIIPTIQKAASGGGKLLQSYKEDILPKKVIENFDELVKGMTKEEFEEFKYLDIDDAWQVKKFMERIADRPRLQDYFFEYWYNSILSGIPTHVANVASATIWGLFQVPIRAVAGALDPVIAQFRPGKQRTRFMNETLPLLAGYGSGIKRGAKAAAAVMRNKQIDEFDSKWAMELGRSKGAFERSPHKILRQIGPYLTVPTDALRAMDLFFNAMAYDGEIRALARRSANLQKLKGAQRAKYERNFIENIPDWAHNEAINFAKGVTFMDDPDPITASIIHMREMVPFGLGKLVIPFVNTISNITKRGAELTPVVGLLKDYGSRAMGRPKNESDVMAKQILGSIIAVYTLNQVVKGNITGPAPKKSSEREAFFRQGKQPWSFKWNGKWVSYRRIEPFNTIFAFAYAFNDSFGKGSEDDKSLTQKFIKFSDTIFKNFIDTSYFSGLQGLFQRYEGAREKQLARTVGTLVPYSGFLRSMGRAYEALTEGEAKLREPERIENVKDIVTALTDVIPIASQKNEPQLNVWGENIVLPGGPFRQWLPYKWSEGTSDRVEKALEKMNKELKADGENEVYPGLPQKYLRQGRRKIDIPDDLYRDYAIYSGTKAKQRLDTVVKSASWDKYKPLTKAKKVDEIIRLERTRARQKLTREMKKRGLLK